MTTIADLSRYDPLEAVDLYDGVILNVEDPGFAQKRDRAIATGKPWGTYIWVYPGQGAAAGQKAHDVGTGSLGAWLDFEQAGATAGDLRGALDRADSLGAKIGVYTYLYILNSVAGELGNHPLWLAYYPGNNDGSYQDWYSNDARARGAILHQYTSSNGTRDLSHVIDDARWTQWTGEAASPGQPPAAPDAAPKDDEMILISEDGGGFFHFEKNALFLTVPGTYCAQVAKGQTFEQAIHNWGALPRCPVPQAFIDGLIFQVLQKDADMKKLLAK